jgi:hypothetical protein
MLSDGNRCKLMLVTTAAITPVTETCEAAEELRETAHMTLAPIVVNKCDPEVPVVDASQLEATMRDAYQYIALRGKAQTEAIGVLTDSLELPQLTVMRRRLSGESLITLMADDLEAAIRKLP